MALRCLLFASDEEGVRPIFDALTALDIDSEYCKSGVDAVEKVSGQVFQIVIADWALQPEASLVLKTAREQKAAQRPLCLAVVSDDSGRPEALRAGANSVLVKPLRAEQLRGTLKTACDLIRAKQPSLAAQPLNPPVTKGAAFSAGASSGPFTMAHELPKANETIFRAGEFLQFQGPAPGAQFDTDSEVQKFLHQVAGSEVDALVDLAPMAAAVSEVKREQSKRNLEALTNWSSLQQSRRPAATPEREDKASAEAKSRADVEMPSYGAGENRDAENKLRQHELAPEAGLLSYMAGESREVRQAGKTPRPARGKLILLVASAAGVVALMALPSTRQTIRAIWGNAAAAGQNWLNPKPAPLPQVAPQHDSFGQSGDEYKLPVAENIPDATTDPAQIRVVPVVDPTAKPGKSLDANGASAESPAAGPNEGGQVQIQEPTTPGVENGAASAGRVPATAQEQAWQPAAPVATQQRPALSRRSSLASNAAIPSSLRSQLASAAPELAGAKSAEATISSIEPVVLPEATAWSLLAQSVDPQYPAVARASGQRGSVILQVMVARDGTVQDAKFMQGSLVFARAAIDAVKQWHFKPYVMNERPVQVQSTITLNFKPPA